MHNDLVRVIFSHLPWDDKMRLMHLVNGETPSQFETARAKLISIDFDPYSIRNNLYTHAINTGNVDLCTEALFRMYVEIFQGCLPIEPFDDEACRKIIRDDMQSKNRQGRVGHVTNVFRHLQG